MYKRRVHSDSTPATPLPVDPLEEPLAQATSAADADSDAVATPAPPSDAQVNFDLEMMRDRLKAQLGESKDPYEDKLPDAKASPKFWVSIGFSLAALFLVAYLFANIMRDAIQSQPVTAGLEEDVLQGNEEVDATPGPTVEVTVELP